MYRCGKENVGFSDGSVVSSWVSSDDEKTITVKAGNPIPSNYYPTKSSYPNVLRGWEDNTTGIDYFDITEIIPTSDMFFTAVWGI